MLEGGFKLGPITAALLGILLPEPLTRMRYRKSSIKPLGAYFILDTPEGGLIREGAYYRGEAYSKS